MELITRYELATKSKNELLAFLRQTFNELAKNNPDTLQRRNALASIENIQRELALRLKPQCFNDLETHPLSY